MDKDFEHSHSRLLCEQSCGDEITSKGQHYVHHDNKKLGEYQPDAWWHTMLIGEQGFATST